MGSDGSADGVRGSAIPYRVIDAGSNETPGAVPGVMRRRERCLSCVYSAHNFIGPVMLRNCILISALIFGCVPILSAEKDTVEMLQTEYNALLQRAKINDSTVDYVRMRQIFVKLPVYNAYGSCIREVETMIKERKLDSAKGLVEACLEKEWVNFSLHFRAFHIYTELKDTVNRNRHLAVITALINALEKTGDALSDSTAIDVLYASEEYSYLSVLGVKFHGQALSHIKNSSYDIMTTKDDEGNIVKYWFRVDNLFASMNKMLKKK